MRFLLDTNIISEGRKPRANANVSAWFERVSSADLFLSVLVLGEIRQGVERVRRRDPDAANSLTAWLDRIRAEYGDRILPITPEVADRWGRLNVPDLLPAVDGLLAATALVHGMTLVTRDIAHIERTGVQLLNPFEPSDAT